MLVPTTGNPRFVPDAGRWEHYGDMNHRWVGEVLLNRWDNDMSGILDFS